MPDHIGTDKAGATSDEYFVAHLRKKISLEMIKRWIWDVPS